MKTYKGTGMVGGLGEGPALVARNPINFTAAMTKVQNVLHKDELCDRHHELFGKRVKGTVLVFPACIGSTHTGLVLLEIAVKRVAPAAIIVKNADSLLVSGAILGEVWYGRGIPLVEYKSEDLFNEIATGRKLRVDGNTGLITIM